MKERLAPWLTKFVVGAAGVMGFYFGGFAAIYFYSRGGALAGTGLGAFAVTAGGAAAAAFLALWGCDALLGASASHVDVLRVLFNICAAALVLYALDAALLKLLDRALPSGLETFALWAAGVYGVWVDEPGGVNWRTLAEALKGLRRR